MPKAVNPDSNNIRVYLKDGQKAKLQQIAEQNGSNTISQLFASVAVGEKCIVDKNIVDLLEYIQFLRKKLKEKGEL